MVKFTKVVPSEVSTETKNEKELSAAVQHSPTPPPVAKQDSIPDIKPEKKENKPKGIPGTVRPMVAGVEVAPAKDESPAPESHGDSVQKLSVNPNETAKRGRGRPPGSGNGSANKKGNSNAVAPKKPAKGVEALTRSIEGFHAMADIVIPGMRLSHAEAALMGEAMNDVMIEFGIEVSGKFAAISTLIGVAAIVEMPKIQLARAYVQDIRKQNRQPKAIAQARAQTAQPTLDVPQPVPVAPKPQVIAEPQSGGLFAHQPKEIAKGEPTQ